MKKVIQEVHVRYPNQDLNDKIAFIKLSVKDVSSANLTNSFELVC
jgi:hypothetical protein